MRHVWWIGILILGGSLCAFGQIETLPSSPNGPGATQAPPRSDRNKEAGESSSRDTRIDISPPKNDAKDHPESGDAVSKGSTNESNDSTSDVQEFHPWNPHKAAKDVEVGDFYFKRKNYRAALDRYKEALLYKDNDAMANLRLGQTYEKLNQPDEAIPHYEAYLKILPHGPFSEEAEKALARLKK
jgi:tetratricopeptide (TPR) repeat protein